MLKKSVSILLALLLTVSLLPAAAAEEEILGSGTCGYAATWTLTGDGTLTIGGTGSMDDYSAENRPGWYELRGAIKNIVFSVNVYTVGAYAFADCSALTSVSLPNCNDIFTGAFGGCSSLRVLRLGKLFAMHSISPSAFAGCQALSDIWCSGTESEWNKISIGEGNEALQNAQLHFPQAAPVIKDTPEYVVAQVGETVRLNVEVEEEGEFIYSYSWSYSKEEPYNHWYGIENGENATLEILVESGMDGYRYQCDVDNGKLALSDSITLVVGFPVTVQPEDAWVEEGQTARFTVEAEDATDWQWQYRPAGSSSWNNCTGSDAKTATLSVVGKSYRDGYEYRCRLSSGNIQIYSRVATLRLYAKPVIYYQTGSTTFSSRVSAYLCVNARNATSYQWQYRPAGSSSWNNCSGDATRNSYVVAGKSYRSGYQYRCIARNQYGADYSNPITLTFVHGQPQILSQPVSASATAGDTAVFTVAASEAEGYLWMYRPAGSSYWNDCSSSDAHSPSLSVAALSYRNGYEYCCMVWNCEGEQYSDVVTLQVTAKSAPVILSQPEAEVSAAKGETVTLTVEASGSAPLRYQWYYCTPTSGYWNKCSSGTGASLAVEAKAYRNGYQYRCLVQNSSGKVYSDPVTLRVQ